MTREQARVLRALIEQASASLPDKEASQGAVLFPRMKGDGALIKAGTRINWTGVVKRAAVDLWDRTDNDPDNAPALWEDIAYRDGVRMIPDNITVGLGFSKGELGWRNGNVYESLLEGNVWTPEAYPDGWRLIGESGAT